ncbi:MAG TPA: hypothetical protein IAD43_05650 [Candidatus Scatomorpha pullicola]|nr:hypothetical protein [Candidatus Scatomorpha pullicola]
MPKSAKKAQQAAAEAERVRLELEALRKRMSAETEADMTVLRVLMDAERQARGVEQAADDYGVGVEWRLQEAVRDIDSAERAEVNKLIESDAAEAAKRADGQIAAERAAIEARRAEILERFEAHRAEYADKVFGLVIGEEDE